jgi:hypothetical protein
VTCPTCGPPHRSLPRLPHCRMMKVDYFAGSTPALIVQANCPRCEDPMQASNLGKIIAGRTACVIWRCSSCGHEDGMQLIFGPMNDEAGLETRPKRRVVATRERERLRVGV